MLVDWFILLRTLSVVLIIPILNVACTDNFCGLQLCDISEEQCQQTTIEAVACIRGDSKVKVPIRTVDEDEYISDYIDETLMEAEESGDSETFIHLNTAYALFGLSESDVELEDVLEERASTIAAYYSNTDEEIIVVDRGKAMNTRGYVALLAHEIVHSLQDQQLDLKSYHEDHCEFLDACLSSASLIEGEAELIEDLVKIELFGTRPENVSWEVVHQNYRSTAFDGMLESRFPIYIADRHFPYSFGLYYVFTAWEEGGLNKVRELYDDIPQSTRRVMAGYDAEIEEDDTWLDDMHDVSEITISDYKFVERNRLGAFIALHFFYRQGLSYKGVVGAHLMTGDFFWTLKHEDTSDIVAVWRMRFDSEEQVEYYHEYFSEYDTWSSDHLETDLILVASESSETSQKVLEGLNFGPD